MATTVVHITLKLQTSNCVSRICIIYLILNVMNISSLVIYVQIRDQRFSDAIQLLNNVSQGYQQVRYLCDAIS